MLGSPTVKAEASKKRNLFGEGSRLKKIKPLSEFQLKKGLTLNKLKPITPGKILLEEFLKPMGLSQYRLAKEIDVPAQRISEIVAGKRSITADTDLRLCRFLGLSKGYWLRAQAVYDTEVAERTLGPSLKKIKPWSAYAARRGAPDEAHTSNRI
jgi:antitoxin HigA-1